ncbi:condensation domain-containing protein [Actinokineospora sp. 24-640]
MPLAKAAGLGWGQRYLWLRHQQQPGSGRHESNLVLNCALETPIPLARLRALVDQVVRRHEGLRTTFHHDIDGDPEQRVHPPAPLPFAVATTERDGTPTPAEVVGAATSTAFDLATEWPVRACAVTTAGVPVRLVLVFDHIAVDRWTVDRIDHDLAVLYGAVTAGRRARMEPVQHQPVDLARHEATAAARPALDWWHAELASLPADTWAARRAPAAGPPAHEATLTSPELVAAARAVAASHGVWPSLVQLTAYAAVTAAYTGSGTVAVATFASNRDLVPYPRVHTCLFSPQLLRVDCSGDPGFAELLGRVADSFAQSRCHTYVPHDAIVERIAREGARRGQQLRLGHELNLIGETWRETRARRTTLVRKPAPTGWAGAGTDTFVRLHEWRDALGITLSVRAELMDTDAVDTFLRTFEQVVVEHERGADPRVSELAARFPAPARALATVAGDPVDLDLVADILRAHPGVDAASVSVVDGELVADAPGRASADELRAHVMARLDTAGAVRCPTRFRAGPDRRAAAPTAAELELAAAVATANALSEVDLSTDYTSAGGRVLRVPRVLDALAARGWTGLRPRELASPVPLRALAARLTTGPRPAPNRLQEAQA